MKLKERITPYVQAVPKILGFKLLTTIVLAIISSLLMLLSRALMRSTGRVSVSSGDFTFLFTTWQGYLMIAIMLVIVLLYVAVEVNALIIYISKILHGENPSVFKCIGKGIAGLKKYLNYRGIIIILYCTLISPMLGLGFSISLTSTFYIPNFITSVIFKNPFYTAGVIALVTFLIVVGIIYCFILHGALIDDMSIKEASIQSRQFLKKNWKNYIFEMLRFLLISAIVIAAMYALFILVPSLIIDAIATDDKAGMFATTLISTFALALFCLFEVLWSAYLIMKLTVLYHNYKSEGEWKYTRPAKKAHPVLIIFAVLGVLLIVGISAVYTYYFDDIIPAFTHAQYVGHRAGGVEAPENTVKGIEVAAELNAYIDEHGSGLNVDQYHWCAAFATAVENKYGNMDFSELDNWNYTPSIQQWAKDQGTWHDAGGDYVPNAGEMLEFDWEADGEVDHIGIVESYDPETGIVTTLEGNSSDSVARREYDVNDWRIAGYISSNVD